MKSKALLSALCTVAACFVAAFVFSACGDKPDNEGPNALEIEGVTFESATYDYDGAEKVLQVTGEIPQGVTVEYDGNKGTNAGVYNATATLSGSGYKTKRLSATLTIEKLDYDMSGVHWQYVEYTFDGDEKSVALIGDFPQGVSVKKYNDAAAIDAGDYTATAIFDYDTVNHNAPVVSPLDWSIAKARITGVELVGATVEYDSKPHSLRITGNLHSSVNIVYYYDGVIAESVTEVGRHEVKCVLSGKNHVTEELNAVLTIKATEELLFCAALDGTVCFQNSLDGNKLYKSTATGVKKISNDTPDSFVSFASTLYYFDRSVWTKSIKSYDGNSTNTLYSQSGEYIATDGSYIYYAVNSLFDKSGNGIYRLPVTPTDDAEPQRLAACEAKYLVYCNGYIYYSASSDKSYLYRVATGGGTPERIMEESVSDLIADQTAVYFNAAKQIAGVIDIAKAVYKYDTVKSVAVKLTTDAGKYLVKLGGYIYYVNNDKLTSAVFGDGIYRVSADLTADSSLPGEKVLSADNNGYCSLSADGSNLYYYKLNDKHLYKYSVSGKTETDVMAGFVPPEETTIPIGFSNLTAHNGEIYYTNPNDSSALYKYDPNTGNTLRVISSGVSGFYFDGDYMYYNTFVVTNYAFWRINLKTNVVEKLSSKRYENLKFVDGTVYGVNYGLSKNIICSFDADMSEVNEIYSDKPANIVGFEKIGNDFYFIMNPKIGYQYIYKYDAVTGTASDLNGIKAKNLAYFGNRLYYYASDDNLKSCDLDGGDIRVHSENVSINYMRIIGNKLYFSSESKTKGLFVLDTASGAVDRIDSVPANGVDEINGKLYWLRSVVTYAAAQPVQSSDYDCRLYCYDGYTVKKVA